MKSATLKAQLNSNTKTRGFTLIEMVVVIALISILAAVALPKMLDSYENAHEAVVYGAGGALSSAVVLVRAQWIANGSFPSMFPWLAMMGTARSIIKCEHLATLDRPASTYCGSGASS